MRKVRQVAIDGDSGSGKSTVGRILADRIRFGFIDSGLFYRASAYAILKKGEKDNRKMWGNIVKKTQFDLRRGIIYIDAKSVSEIKLRSKEIDNFVSPVSTIREIREVVTNALRRIANSKNVVMVGRDIGSVVLKDAFLKIYLTAPIDVRAERRYKELIKKGINVTLEELLNNLRDRDMIDSTRDISPLMVPEEAYVIDTGSLPIRQIVEKIIQFMKGKEYALHNNSWSS